MAGTRMLDLPAPAGSEAIDLERGSVFFVGNATTVIRYAGFTILTDPNFLHAGDHAHLGYGITSKRLTNPAIEIEDLPPLDLCVLSHLHGDHWDHIAAAKLRKDLPVITTPHAARGLTEQGFTHTIPLETWQAFEASKGPARLRITSTPGRHGPAGIYHMLPPVMGSLLEWWTADGDTASPRFRLYISGDTLVFDDLKEIPWRFPGIDLAMLHLGGTRILGIFVTMDARQGVRLLRIIQPRQAIPIHYNDYDAFKSPLADFMREIEKAGLPTEVHYLAHGDTFPFEVPPRG